MVPGGRKWKRRCLWGRAWGKGEDEAGNTVAVCSRGSAPARLRAGQEFPGPGANRERLLARWSVTDGDELERE
jgi:hypothetical protein